MMSVTSMKIIQKVLKLLLYLILIVTGGVTIFPFVWTFSSSFKTMGEIFQSPPTLIPVNPILTNYIYIFTRTALGRWFLNSTIVTVSSVVLGVFFSSLGGLALAKYTFPFRHVLFMLILGTLIIPFHVVVIPLYIEIMRLGGVNKYWALVLPFSASPFGIFMMRQYMLAIPMELFDSARIDGCSEFRIYSSIVLPLSRAAIGVLSTYMFIFNWNNLFWPLIILNSERKFTLPLGLATLWGTYQAQQQWGPLMAGCFLSTIPLLVTFLLMQKQFITGLTLGSVKG